LLDQFATDHPLVDVAQQVFTVEDFVVRRLELPEAGQVVVAAEDDYSLAAILAGDDWSSVSERISPLDVALSNWVAAQSPSAKKWDIYLVCLVQHHLSQAREFAEAERYELDTRRVRKYVRDGIVPDEADVRRALAPFLPLRSASESAVLDPLALLERKLRARGVDAATARIGIETFVATGKVSISP